ncbi:hypothetical protein CKA32_007000 [Geitlerinema sp. FC II]|nr:hypothetical protein CKA32_007000 [Geitlerinema sp. FC II]
MNDLQKYYAARALAQYGADRRDNPEATIVGAIEKLGYLSEPEICAVGGYCSLFKEASDRDLISKSLELYLSTCPQDFREYLRAIYALVQSVAAI